MTDWRADLGMRENPLYLRHCDADGKTGRIGRLKVVARPLIFTASLKRNAYGHG
jgi:hypothetical protein